MATDLFPFLNKNNKRANLNIHKEAEYLKIRVIESEVSSKHVQENLSSTIHTHTHPKRRSKSKRFFEIRLIQPTLKKTNNAIL